jgi:hypothetical protein
MTVTLPPGSVRDVISGDFFTPGYRLTGKLSVGHAGLIRQLNDTTSSLAEFQDVYVSRASEPGKILTHFSMALVPKTRLELALVSRREDIGPLGVARGGFAKVHEHQVLVATSNFEVRGVLEQPGRLDVPSVLFEGSAKFFLLYKATIIALAAPEVQFTAGAVLVNRSRIDLFCPQEAEG